MESPPGAETVIDGRRYVYFGGTSYLGLAGHPAVIEAACAAARQYGLHTATSRNGFGTSPALLEVERQAAAFFGAHTAFHYASGYLGSHILVQTAVSEPGQALVCLDEAVHFCAREAASIVAREIVEFRHRDPDSLRAVLRQKAPPDRPILVMTDGVSPGTGAIAPLAAYFEICGNYEHACLLVDDAHGVGVLGAEGRGAIEWAGLWGHGVNQAREPDPERLLLCATLSKAMGGFGGIIPASEAFLARLRRRSHGFEGASAPPVPVAAATAKAIEIVRGRPVLRQCLASNSARLRRGLRRLGLPVSDEPTAHVGLSIGGKRDMARLHEALKGQGFLVPYLGAYPGICPEGLLRFAVCATHTDAMIDTMLAALGRLL